MPSTAWFDYTLPKNVIFVLVINVLLNIYVWILYLALETIPDLYDDQDFTLVKRVNLLESAISIFACFIIERRHRSFTKNLIQFLTLICVVTLFVFHTLFNIPILTGLVNKKAWDPSKGIWIQVGIIVLLTDCVFKIIAILVFYSFLGGIISIIDPLTNDNSSEQGILLDDHVNSTSEPPSYDECTSSMPPSYNDIYKF